jgi:L-alanine-DL-glutamate epimerase-like enolase superfamily enzyme
VAAAIGHKMKLAVDANQGWRVTIVADAPLWDLERARRFADRCADAGVAWLEEPLAMDAYEDLAALTAYSRVPIAGGELHTGGLAELKMMIERRCYKIFQPDAVFTGGIAQTMEVARLCRRHGLIYSPHTWTNGIGLAVNLQLFAASGFAQEKALEYPISPPGWTVEARDGILQSPFVHEKGTLAVPDRPGLGFEIDRSALKKYGRRFFVMDRKRLAWYSIRHRGLKATLEINRNRRRSKRK